MLNMQNNNIQQLISTIDSFILEQIIDRLTRVTGNSAFLGDLLFISKTEKEITLIYENTPNICVNSLIF